MPSQLPTGLVAVFESLVVPAGSINDLVDEIPNIYISRLIMLGALFENYGLTKFYLVTITPARLNISLNWMLQHL